MFHAPMGRFQLELIYYFAYFSSVVPYNICVCLSCRPFVVNATFSTGLVGVENVVLTTKGILVRINLLSYLFFHRRPIQHLCVSCPSQEIEET